MRRAISAGLALALLATPGLGSPTIVHDPIKVAEKGAPLGVRATVRDAAARVEEVSLFYASSRGMTPFRAAMSSSGAGVWFGTIPGHLMGPGAEMFYYIQAENADGEVRETDWQSIRLVEAGIAPEAIPSASSVAQQAPPPPVAPVQPVAAEPATPAKPGKAKYLVPLAVIAGGAVAIGGALAIENHNSGGGGGSGGSGTNAATDGNYGGSYEVCFAPSVDATASTSSVATVTSNALQAATNVCDSGLANVYVTAGNVEVVGLWASDVMTGAMNGSLFTIVREVAATSKFPAARLIVSGEIVGTACTIRLEGFSTDTARAGTFTGRLDATRR